MIAATVCGNLGKDAEFSVTPNGKEVLNFSIAAKGKSKEDTIWVRGAMWGARGKAIQQYLTKGTKVTAVGKLTTREYEGKTYLELDVQEIDFMSTRDGKPTNVTGHKTQQGAGDLPF